MPRSDPPERVPEPAILTVCYDAECELCTESVARLRRLDRSSRLRWVPYQQIETEMPEAAARLDQRALGSALHVIERDGSITSGAAAVLRVAEVLPRLRPFARLGRLPLVNRLVNPMYRLIARHRHRLGHLLSGRA